MSEYCTVITNSEVIEASVKDGIKTIAARDQTTGEIIEAKGEEILVAAGRRSNSDMLQPENTGVKTDDGGWIIVNEFLETSKENIWALGDAVNRGQFRHTANYHSELVWQNAFGRGNKVPIDEHAIPHGVFGYPQVAGVGLTEKEATEQFNEKILVGRARYADVAMGYSMGDEESFCKVIVDAESYRILGASIVGPHATLLIQSIIYLMNAGDGGFMPIWQSQVIHPALSEVITRAFGRLTPVGGGPVHHH